ncbi:MAG: alpha/beta hydrolase [Flavobacteriaceae bacterium]|nr:alpha/beta hydrolase [Flavobacteriaceae bacterium]MDG1974785.1 alpha/beta hydrolase [Flavobacteriaceae bacterium]
MIHVYLMPGMSANSLIFEKIKFPKNFELHKLDWISPNIDESIENYAERLSEKIVHKNPVLIGVSFGGILVQEISKIIKVNKLIIISSIKCNKEMPSHMKFGKITKSYKLLPVKWINDFESLISFVLGPKIKKRVDLYRKYLSVRDENYLSWSLREMIEWKQSKPLKNIIHIHGTKDLVFPTLYIKNFIEVPRGDHAMILKRAEWINQNLPKMIM